MSSNEEQCFVNGSLTDKWKNCFSKKEKSFRKFFSKLFLKFQKLFCPKIEKIRIFWKISKENPRKNALNRLIWFIYDSTQGLFRINSEKLQKTSKKFKKLLKKVLTFWKVYDILHERSTEERQKQRSLKIEQQQIRTN